MKPVYCKGGGVRVVVDDPAFDAKVIRRKYSTTYHVRVVKDVLERMKSGVIKDTRPRVRCSECNRRMIPQFVVGCEWCDEGEFRIPPHRPKQDFFQKKTPKRLSGNRRSRLTKTKSRAKRAV